MTGRIVLCAVLLVLPGVPEAKDSYLVSAEIFRGGKLIGAPALRVRSEDQPVVSTGEDYRLGVTVSQSNNGAVQVASDLTVSSKQIRPVMILELGKEGVVQMGSIRLVIAVHQISG